VSADVGVVVVHNPSGGVGRPAAVPGAQKRRPPEAGRVGRRQTNKLQNSISALASTAGALCAPQWSAPPPSWRPLDDERARALASLCACVLGGPSRRLKGRKVTRQILVSSFVFASPNVFEPLRPCLSSFWRAGRREDDAKDKSRRPAQRAHTYTQSRDGTLLSPASKAATMSPEIETRPTAASHDDAPTRLPFSQHTLTKRRFWCARPSLVRAATGLQRTNSAHWRAALAGRPCRVLARRPGIDLCLLADARSQSDIGPARYAKR
jgi:hypothetical protein